MKNIFSVDLEDWHQLIRRRTAGGGLPPPSRHVFRQTEALLDLLQAHGVRATFFVMGALAARFPELVERVAAQGHEIASHGFDHLLVYRLSPQAFRDDARRSKELLEDLTGQPVHGYRAAEFSIRRESLWALEVLAELGFTYDSSIFPIHHRRYGVADFAPEVRRYRLPGGRTMVEVPPSTLPLGRLNLPAAGGGYFRILPRPLIRHVAAHLNRRGRPLVTYFHPYEFDPQRLDLFDAFPAEGRAERLRGLRFNLHQNVGRASVTPKVAELLSVYEFTTCHEYLKHTPTHGSLPLFS